MLELELFSRRNFAVGNAETLGDVRRARDPLLLPDDLPPGGRGLHRARERAHHAARDPRDVRALAPVRRARRPPRPAPLHGRRPPRRRGRHPAAPANGAGHVVPHRPAARAARLRARAVAHRCAARRHGSRRRRRERRRHRIRDQQRCRARRRPGRRLARRRRRREHARRRHLRTQRRVGTGVPPGAGHLRSPRRGGGRHRRDRDRQPAPSRRGKACPGGQLVGAPQPAVDHTPLPSGPVVDPVPQEA